MKKLFLVIASVFLLTAYESASACSCGGYPSPCEAYNAADAVFIGVVKKASPEYKSNEYIGEQQVTVLVERAFKGVKENQEIVFNQPGHNCAPKYASGTRCLFYATFHKQTKTWEEEGCNRGGALERVHDDLLFLQALPASANKNRLAGTLEHYEDTPEKGFELVNLLAGAKVKLTNEDKTYEIYTDRNGVYEIYDLPPGNYSIEPEIPSGLKIRFPIFYGANDSSRTDSVKVNVSAKSCVSVDFVLSSDTVIKGKVLGANGEAMPSVCLELVPADKTASGYFRKFDCTEKDGAYEINEIPPGNYLIILNKEDRLSGRTPFHTLYFPGVSDKGKATVITLKAGAKLENYNIYVPSQIPTVTIQGKLLFSDGHPVVDEYVEFKYDDQRYESNNGKTDEQGRFSIKVIQGATGQLVSDLYLGFLKEAECPHIKKLIEQFGDRNPKVETKPLKVEAKQDVRDLILTFPFAFCPKDEND